MKLKRKIKKVEINEIISWLVRIILILAILESIFTKKYQNIFIAVLTLIMTFYPSILKKRLRVYLPAGLQVIITLFIFSAQFLGELHNFYYKFSWWDDMLHCISGGVLGIIGFMFVYLLNKTHIKQTKLSQFFIVLFAFCFSITMGVLWEFCEFGCDRLLGLNMQKFRLPGEDGLIDTMTDLMVDTIGAFIVSLVGYIYIKSKNKILGKKIIDAEEWIKKQTELEKVEK